MLLKPAHPACSTTPQKLPSRIRLEPAQHSPWPEEQQLQKKGVALDEQHVNLRSKRPQQLQLTVKTFEPGARRQEMVARLGTIAVPQPL